MDNKRAAVNIKKISRDIGEELNLKTKDVEKVIKLFIKKIKQRLFDDKIVAIKGFVTFKKVKRKPRRYDFGKEGRSGILPSREVIIAKSNIK